MYILIQIEQKFKGLRNLRNKREFLKISKNNARFIMYSEKKT